MFSRAKRPIELMFFLPLLVLLVVGQGTGGGADTCNHMINQCKFIGFDKGYIEQTLKDNNPATWTNFNFTNLQFAGGDTIVVASHTITRTLNVTDDINDTYVKRIEYVNISLDLYNVSSIWTTTAPIGAAPTRITVKWNSSLEATLLVTSYTNVERVGLTALGHCNNSDFSCIGGQNLFNMTIPNLGASSWFYGTLAWNNPCVSNQPLTPASNLVQRLINNTCGLPPSNIGEDMTFNTVDTNAGLYPNDLQFLKGFFLSETTTAIGASVFTLLGIELVGYAGTSLPGTWNNMPSATTELFGSDKLRQILGIPGVFTTKLNFTVGCIIPSNHAGAKLQLQWAQYATGTGTNTTAFQNLGFPIFIDNSAGNPCPGIQSSNTFAAPATGTLMLRVVGLGGGGSGDNPQLSLVQVSSSYTFLRTFSCISNSVTLTTFKALCFVSVPTSVSTAISINWIATNNGLNTQSGNVASAVTIPINGVSATSAAQTFAVAYAATPQVLIQPTSSLAGVNQKVSDLIIFIV